MNFSTDDPTAGAATLQKLAGEASQLTTDAGPLTLARHAPGVLRMTLGGGADAGLLGQPTAGDAAPVEAGPGSARIADGGLVLEVLGGPLRLRFSIEGQTLVESAGFAGGAAPFPAVARARDGWWLAFALDTSRPVHGLGEKFGPLDRRGQLIVSANHASPGVASERSAKNVPFVWSPRGWGLFVHTRGHVVNGIGYPQWSLRAHVIKVEDERLDLLFIGGATPEEIIQRFAALTGRVGEQPLWSLGAWVAAGDAAATARDWRGAELAGDVMSGAASSDLASHHFRACMRAGAGDALELADTISPADLIAALGAAPAGRPVWSRAAWTGTQARATPCGGDAEADWEGLAASVRGALSWSLSGGGAHATEVVLPPAGTQANSELWLRWLQFGVLGSHLRIHDAANAPWRHDAGVLAILREWLSLRYRLLPYLQGCLAEASRSGLPVRRPMALAFPKDPAAHPFDTQYMLGSAILVAPVLQPGGQVRVYLPEGLWHDIWTGRFFPGERTITVAAPSEYIPVFGRDGHSLPLGPAVRHTGELDPSLGPAGRLDELWLFSLPTAPPLLGEPFTGNNAVLFAGNWDRSMFGNLPAEVRLREIGDVVAKQTAQGWLFTRKYGVPGKAPG